MFLTGEVQCFSPSVLPDTKQWGQGVMPCWRDEAHLQVLTCLSLLHLYTLLAVI